MSDFLKDLEGKAYQLVSGMITLEEFKGWYAEAQAEKAPGFDSLHVKEVAEPEGGWKNKDGTPFVPGKPAILGPSGEAYEPDDREEFEGDYTSPKPKLDAPSEPDPEWAVGTGDRKQWPPA